VKSKHIITQEGHIIVLQMGGAMDNLDFSNDVKKVKRVYSNKQRKNRTINTILTILAILLFVAGVVLLLINPIQNYFRNQVTKDAVNVVESQLALGQTEITYIVPANANVVNGEEYEFFGNSDQIASQQASMEEAQANLPDEVVLNYLGIIDIESVEVHLPLWDESSLVALRYGAGHYESSVLPGQIGNCSILGHRMTQEGSLFNRLGEVVIGDTIRITTVDGNEYLYVVDEILTILPEELEDMIGPDVSDERQITLVTCTPTGVGSHRLLIIGHMVEENN